MISNLVPSDPVASNLSQAAMENPEVVEAYKEKWGLDGSLFSQFTSYFQNLLMGDLGTSIRTGNPVLEYLLQFFPATLVLSIVAMVFALIFDVLFGVFSAIYRLMVLYDIVRT